MLGKRSKSPPAPPEHSTGLARSSAGYSWERRKFFPFLVLELLHWVQAILQPCGTVPRSLREVSWNEPLFLWLPPLWPPAP